MPIFKVFKFQKIILNTQQRIVFFYGFRSKLSFETNKKLLT